VEGSSQNGGTSGPSQSTKPPTRSEQRLAANAARRAENETKEKAKLEAQAAESKKKAEKAQAKREEEVKKKQEAAALSAAGPSNKAKDDKGKKKETAEATPVDKIPDRDLTKDSARHHAEIEVLTEERKPNPDVILASQFKKKDLYYANVPDKVWIGPGDVGKHSELGKYKGAYDRGTPLHSFHFFILLIAYLFQTTSTNLGK